jgi:hypothetical protein
LRGFRFNEFNYEIKVNTKEGWEREYDKILKEIKDDKIE